MHTWPVIPALLLLPCPCGLSSFLALDPLGSLSLPLQTVVLCGSLGVVACSLARPDVLCPRCPAAATYLMASDILLSLLKDVGTKSLRGAAEASEGQTGSVIQKAGCPGAVSLLLILLPQPPVLQACLTQC